MEANKIRTMRRFTTEPVLGTPFNEFGRIPVVPGLKGNVKTLQHYKSFDDTAEIIEPCADKGRKTLRRHNTSYMSFDSTTSVEIIEFEDAVEEVPIKLDLQESERVRKIVIQEQRRKWKAHHYDELNLGRLEELEQHIPTIIQVLWIVVLLALDHAMSQMEKECVVGFAHRERAELLGGILFISWLFHEANIAESLLYAVNNFVAWVNTESEDQKRLREETDAMVIRFERELEVAKMNQQDEKFRSTFADIVLLFNTELNARDVFVDKNIPFIEKLKVFQGIADIAIDVPFCEIELRPLQLVKLREFSKCLMDILKNNGWSSPNYSSYKFQTDDVNLVDLYTQKRRVVMEEKLRLKTAAMIRKQKNENSWAATKNELILLKESARGMIFLFFVEPVERLYDVVSGRL